MKKYLKVLCATAGLACCISFPAFAAETKAEYKEASAPVRSEMKAVDNEMKPVREENKKISAKFKSVRLSNKNGGALSVDKEDWKKAKELHKKIVEIRKEMKKNSIKTLKAEAKSQVKAKEFDDAIGTLKEALDIKKTKLDSMKEVNTLWRQIDSLIES